MSQEVDWVKAMFGENAAHAPVQLCIQDMGEGTVIIVGASKFQAPHPFRFGSSSLHQLVQGDLVLRPHWVGETDTLRGFGVSGILTSSQFGDPDAWRTILDPVGVPRRGARA